MSNLVVGRAVTIKNLKVGSGIVIAFSEKREKIEWSQCAVELINGKLVFCLLEDLEFKSLLSDQLKTIANSLSGLTSNSSFKDLN